MSRTLLLEKLQFYEVYSPHLSEQVDVGGYTHEWRVQEAVAGRQGKCPSQAQAHGLVTGSVPQGRLPRVHNEVITSPG